MTSSRVAGCAGLLFALFFAGLALNSMDIDSALGEPGVRTAQATVLEVRDCSGRGCGPYLVVRFPTDRGAVTTELHDLSWEPRPRVGAVLVVRYNERDPTLYLRDARLGPDRIGQGMLLSFAVIFGVYGIIRLTGRSLRR